MRHYWVTLGKGQRQCANCDAEQHREEDGKWTYDDMDLGMGNHRCETKEKERTTKEADGQ